MRVSAGKQRQEIGRVDSGSSGPRGMCSCMCVFAELLVCV